MLSDGAGLCMGVESFGQRADGAPYVTDRITSVLGAIVAVHHSAVGLTFVQSIGDEE